MNPNITYGRRVRGLLEYLWGPGKSDEHTTPRIVAGYDLPEVLAPPRDSVDRTRWALTELAGKLDAPQVVAGERGMRKYVWQCSLSLPPYENGLDDDTWGRFATRFVEEMGFAGDAAGAGCRWIAVHHGQSVGGNDHVHVVVTLATEDGAPVWLRGDKARSQKVVDMLEDEFRLGKWCRRDQATPRQPATRADVEQSRKAGRPGPDREVLRREVRAALAGAASEADWVARMKASGLLVAIRAATDAPGRVVGYAVALKPAGPKDKPRWLAGRSLDGELSLVRVRQRWLGAEPLSASGWKAAAPAEVRVLRALDRMALWRSSAVALEDIAGRLAGVTPASSQWPAIARASADMLARVAVAAEPSGNGPVSRAADILARAAAPRRREPPPVSSQIAAELGRVADAVMVAGAARDGSEAAMVLAIVVAAARLVVLMAELRTAQQQLHAAGAAQAAAARLLPVLRQAQQLPSRVVSAGGESPGQATVRLGEWTPMDRPVVGRERGGRDAER